VTAATAVAADALRPLADLPLMDRDERRRLLEDWNCDEIALPAYRPLVRQIEDHASRRPEAMAVSWRNGALSYARINGLANGLARRLGELGVHTDAVVGLDLARSPDLVIAMLAVWKAGAAYVPLPPDLPRERRAAMAADAGSVLMVTGSTGDPAAYSGHTLLTLDLTSLAPVTDNSRQVIAADQLAYVLFTSGSTGRPKGAALRHGGLTNNMQWLMQRDNIGPSDVFYQKTAIGFDASVMEFWSVLPAGGRLLLAAPDGHQDPRNLVEDTLRDSAAERRRQIEEAEGR